MSPTHSSALENQSAQTALQFDPQVAPKADSPSPFGQRVPSIIHRFAKDVALMLQR